MKIVICGSMKLSSKMIDIKKELEKYGHKAILPKHAEKYHELGFSDNDTGESVKNKIENDLIRDYYEEIKNSEGVLIVNDDLRGIKNYIGGNSFLEMAFGHVLNKKVFLLNSIPDASYKDEIIAMQPIVLNGNLSNVK